MVVSNKIKKSITWFIILIKVQISFSIPVLEKLNYKIPEKWFQILNSQWSYLNQWTAYIAWELRFLYFNLTYFKTLNKLNKFTV